MSELNTALKGNPGTAEYEIGATRHHFALRHIDDFRARKIRQRVEFMIAFMGKVLRHIDGITTIAREKFFAPLGGESADILDLCNDREGAGGPLRHARATADSEVFGCQLPCSPKA